MFGIEQGEGFCMHVFSIHLLDLPRNSCEKCNFRSLAGIEPAALRFKYPNIQIVSRIAIPAFRENI
jgi:hypothetical protein